ncbi:ALF repeat-containing protein [Streptomyces sp. NPDC088725]|uniref:ALF repeat-containing protein n=1 Tax=Streptomyces sp. NPDC088725 TaxID=3365873 RepID=UPI00381E82A1
MRQTRTAFALAATALASALLLTTPALAAPPAATNTAVAAAAAPDGSTTPMGEMSEEDLRIAILRIMAGENSGRGVVREASAALDGTVEDMRAFLKTGYRLAQAEDDRVAIATILATTDPQRDKGVIREINKVLDTNTPEALRAFLETGYRLARAEDDRVAIARILADKNISDALRAAAEDVIDGTPEELRYFLEHGQYEV